MIDKHIHADASKVLYGKPMRPKYTVFKDWYIRRHENPEYRYWQQRMRSRLKQWHSNSISSTKLIRPVTSEEFSAQLTRKNSWKQTQMAESAKYTRHD